ncbi:MAG: signal peptidase I [Lachnospiraceae bacterium]|nr:signal peptidase I [Lachnospiraceae bacterium]
MQRKSRRRRRKHNIQEFTFRNKRISFNKKAFFKEVLNWTLLIFVAVIVGYSIVTFLFQTVTVVGPSMENTLKDGQVVVVNKIEYKFKDVKRYDIIAYSQVDSDEYYEIKRVIGLPEETVLIDDGCIFINGEQLTDVPFDDKILTAGIAGKEIVLSEDEYFVLGDNVNNSEDSRYSNVGNITSQEILGKVVYIYSPKEYRGKVK